jgi:hypothetical protein
MAEIQDILTLLHDSSPILVFIAVLAYFLKVYLEKLLEGIAGRVEEIAKTSLEVKRGIREEERRELVDLRVAVEKWEYFLQTVAFDFSMSAPADAKIPPLYEKDKEHFLDVKIAIIKASTYLRDKDLEQQLMSAIINIRNTYYPIINETLPKLIDLQTKLTPIQNKLEKFKKSSMHDMSFAPNQEDQEENLRLQTMMTAELNSFSQKFLEQYPTIAKQMYELKESINKYIYRPMQHTEIDKD